MPPEPPRSDHDNILEEYPTLTDQNVAILYQIIRAAEQHPNVETQPFRALFAQYDEILPQHGLDPAHDQIYLRFLFKLGDKREAGQSLYNSFEHLLEELGIQIEFNSEEEGIQEVTRNLGGGEHGIADLSLVINGSKHRSRRASFDSIYYAEDESSRASRGRAESRASLSQLQITQPPAVDERPSTRATTRPTEKIANACYRDSAAKTGETRLRAGEFASDLKHYQYQREAELTTDERKHGFASMPAHSQSLTSISSLRSSDTGGDVASPANRDQLAFRIGSQDRLYATSRTQLLRDAETFQYYRIQSVARDIIDRWCDAALEARSHHESMEHIAKKRDTDVLLRQALDHWRTKMRVKKQAAETERFFKHLERRAVKARDLYLLTKAFTHWAECAYQQSRRTALARQRILCIKYFYAWRDITIENQNKVQLQVFRKFFGIWKQRYAQALVEDHWAGLLRRHMLLRSGYWSWFWAFCERRAPEWRDRKLKQRYFLQWAVAFSNNRRRVQSVAQNANETTKKKIFSQWLERARICLFNQQKAASLNNQRAAEHALQAWTMKRRFAPLNQQVSTMIDWRVAGETFTIFVNRYRAEKQAETVNRLRILRGFWTHWNDKLRWQTLARRRDDCSLLEALYRWVVAGRLILLQRLLQERLKYKIFSTFRTEVYRRQTRREDVLESFRVARDKRTLQSSLGQWRSQHDSLRQAERIAFEFYAPKVAKDSFDLWLQKLRYNQMAEGWAKDARYFFLAKRYIKRWRAAARESRRQKRRDAYVQIRRRGKVNLAAGVLQRWRNLTANVQEMNQDADAANQARLLRIGTILFNSWRNSTDTIVDQDLTARKHYQNGMLRRCLQIWIERISYQWELEETADANAQLHVHKTAFIFLRKLRLRIIELKGQEGKAEGLRSNYRKRHLQNIVWQWRDKTALRQNRPVQDPTFSSRARRTRPHPEGDDRLGSTTRAEHWTEFDINEWIPATETQATTTTPLPGYLSTPSKRAARAKALVHSSTTPAGTPFQSRLRAQLNATPRTTKRGALGRPTGLRNAFGLARDEGLGTGGMEGEGEE